MIAAEHSSKRYLIVSRDGKFWTGRASWGTFNEDIGRAKTYNTQRSANGALTMAKRYGRDGDAILDAVVVTATLNIACKGVL